MAFPFNTQYIRTLKPQSNRDVSDQNPGHIRAELDTDVRELASDMMQGSEVYVKPVE